MTWSALVELVAWFAINAFPSFAMYFLGFMSIKRFSHYNYLLCLAISLIPTSIITIAGTFRSKKISNYLLPPTITQFNVILEKALYGIFAIQIGAMIYVAYRAYKPRKWSAEDLMSLVLFIAMGGLEAGLTFAVLIISFAEIEGQSL